MNARTLERVVLAECPDFTIGPLRARPPLREIEANGRVESVEPRVMQVLVALWRNRNAVVSRAALIDACWDGRIIGDDAVHRCIARVRRIGDEAGAFALKTIARVGYRLEPGETADREPVLAIPSFSVASDDPRLQAFAETFVAELSHALQRAKGLKVLGQAAVSRFASRGDAGSLADELGVTHVLSAALRGAGRHVRLTLQVIDTESDATIAREQIDVDPVDFERAPDDVASAVARALGVVSAPSQPHGAPHALFAEVAKIRQVGHVLRTYDLTAKNIAVLESWTAQHPRFAAGWGQLAASQAYFAEFGEDDALSTQARTAAHRALALDPRCSDAYAAISISAHAPGSQFEKVEAAMRAVEFAPSDPAAIFLAGAARFSVGHVRRAAALLERGQMLDPDRGYTAMALMTALHAIGRRTDAEAVVASLDRDGSPYRFWARLFLAAEKGEWIDVHALFADAPDAYRPPPTFLMAMDAMARLQHAEPAERRAGLTLLFDAAPHGTLFLTAMACNLGEPGLAFDRLMRAFDAERTVRNVTGANWTIPRAFSMLVLFDTSRAPLVGDPRFPTLAARLGLTRFWIETDDWPDCADVVPYDFRARCREADLQSS